MASNSIILANRWGKCGNCHFSFSWAPKSMQMVTAAKKLKDSCCLVLDLRGNAFSLSLLSMMLAVHLSSVQLLSWIWPFVTLWTRAHQASLSINKQLLEFTQTHVHWVGDAIQPSHPLLSPSPPTSISFPASGSFQISSSHQVAKVLEFQLQHQSFRWMFRTIFL